MRPAVASRAKREHNNTRQAVQLGMDKPSSLAVQSVRWSRAHASRTAACQSLRIRARLPRLLPSRRRAEPWFANIGMPAALVPPTYDVQVRCCRRRWHVRAVLLWAVRLPARRHSRQGAAHHAPHLRSLSGQIFPPLLGAAQVLCAGRRVRDWGATLPKAAVTRAGKLCCCALATPGARQAASVGVPLAARHACHPPSPSRL